ncbi:MAG TPA: hypothetical protein VIV61_08780 [Candidatus Ozemobacteraceae bacterium]
MQQYARRFNFGFLGLSPAALGLLLTVLAGSPATAQSAVPADADETEGIAALAQEHSFAPANSEKDPFKPLVTKPAPPKQEESVTPPPATQAVEIKPVIQPLQIRVTGICGNDDERLAMIEYKQKSYVVFKEMTVDGSFKVVDILSDNVVVYSIQEQMRRTFPIGGGKE